MVEDFAFKVKFDHLCMYIFREEQISDKSGWREMFVHRDTSHPKAANYISKPSIKDPLREKDEIN